MAERIARFPEVKSTSGQSRSTVYNRIKDGLWPPPIKLGPRMVGWRESELAALNAARIRGDSEDDIRALVTRLLNQRKQIADGSQPAKAA